MKAALYTVTYSGVFYEGPHLELKDIFPRVADLGYDGIEIGAKRPIASPIDLNTAARNEIKALGPRYGLEIPCVAGYTDFTSGVPEHREMQLLMLRETIRLAHDLEAPFVRIFAAWSGITMREGHGVYEISRSSYNQPDVTHLEKWHWARECIEEASRWAEKYGVVLALQNHSPVTSTLYHTLEMIEEVNSPWVKACIDAPLITDQSDEYIYAGLIRTGDLQVWSHFGGYLETPDGKISEEMDKGTIIVNYPAFFRGLRDIGYQGYIAYEGCGPVLVNHNWGGLDEVDRRAKLALEYIRRQIGVVNKNK